MASATLDTGPKPEYPGTASGRASPKFWAPGDPTLGRFPPPGAALPAPDAVVRWLSARVRGVAAQAACAWFRAACRFGQLAVAQWLDGRHAFEPGAVGAGELVRHACAGGHLETAVWLAGRFGLAGRFDGPADVHSVRGALRDACAGGHLAVARWLAAAYDLGPEDARAGNCAPLRAACGGGHQVVAAWRADAFTLADADVCADGALVLRAACAGGHRATAEWLAARYAGLGARRRDLARALQAACAGGHLATAQWLAAAFGLGPADARADSNAALRGACRQGACAVAAWLADAFGLGPADARAGDSAALRAACAGGHLGVARWLVARFGLGPADAHLDRALAAACAGGHLAVVRWLGDPAWAFCRRSLAGAAATAAASAGACLAIVPRRPDAPRALWPGAGAGERRQNAHAALRAACAGGHLGVVRWLTDAGGVDIRGGHGRRQNAHAAYAAIHAALEGPPCDDGALDDVATLLHRLAQGHGFERDHWPRLWGAALASARDRADARLLARLYTPPLETYTRGRPLPPGGAAALWAAALAAARGRADTRLLELLWAPPLRRALRAAGMLLDPGRALEVACVEGRLGDARLLAAWRPPPPAEQFRALCAAAVAGCPGSAQWLAALQGGVGRTGVIAAFHLACRYGNLEAGQELSDAAGGLGPGDAAVYDSAAAWAAAEGHGPVAAWLRGEYGTLLGGGPRAGPPRRLEPGELVRQHAAALGGDPAVFEGIVPPESTIEPD